MTATDFDIQLLRVLTIVLSVPALLNVEVKGKTSWVLYYPLLPVAAYILYEVALRFAGSPRGFPIDLIFIWPLLVLVLGKTWYRWLQFSKDERRPVTRSTEYGLTAFVAGVVGFIPPGFVCSLMAVVYGHRAIGEAGQEDFKGKRLAGFGMIAGYGGLLVAALFLMNVFLSRSG